MKEANRLKKSIDIKTKPLNSFKPPLVPQELTSEAGVMTPAVLSSETQAENGIQIVTMVQSQSINSKSNGGLSLTHTKEQFFEDHTQNN